MYFVLIRISAIFINTYIYIILLIHKYTIFSFSTLSFNIGDYKD
jgi:hypothetical protein